MGKSLSKSPVYAKTSRKPKKSDRPATVMMNTNEVNMFNNNAYNGRHQNSQAMSPNRIHSEGPDFGLDSMVDSHH